MNKEKQKEILEGCGEAFDIISYGWVTCGKYYNNVLGIKDDRIVYCKSCKQKANEHKAEVLKGCGKRFYGKYKRIMHCIGKFSLCEDCKKIIDKYEEVGIWGK